MSRHLCVALILFFAHGVSVFAQDPLIATRVFTEPQGLRFFVDGVPYLSAQTFLWPAGSKHTIMVERAQAPFTGQRNVFSGWADSTGTLSSGSDTITVTATPALTFIKATFSIEYLIRVLFYSCTGPADSCRPPGSVSVGGSLSSTDVETWAAPGTELVLQAFPNPGYVFVNWGAPSNYSTSFVYRHIVTGPATFSGIFAGARRVNLVSEPPGLLLAPDRTPTKSPAEMDWARGSRHVLGAVSPQNDPDNAGVTWVFSHWSNGARLNDVYTVPDNNIAETITGHFVRGVNVSFLTSPPGLKLRVEGRDNWPAYNFVWGVGMKYRISAPLEQTDARGRKYVFKGWSNGGPADQEVTITNEHLANGFRLTATYEPQSRLSIQTDPPGLPVRIDGVECRANCVYDRAEGAQIQLQAPASVPISDSSRFEFQGWSDGGPSSRTYTFTGEPQKTLVARFKSMFKLTALAEPAEGAAFRLDPVTADGFYDRDAVVVVTAQAKPGFRFKRWDGDLTGSYHSGVVTMNVPRVVRAIFEIVPFVEEAGVRNAAGETPEPVVAAGSIASIYGVHLAGAYERGPVNPLAQSIGGVTVRLENRLLPLLFVSPEQVNFLVPSDLAEGRYKVTLKWEHYPEVVSTMTVARNAPGLFESKSGDRMLAVAMRENGEPVAVDAPARRGEIVTVVGTGFGPYERPAPDGFPLPAEPAYPLLDAVEVLAGEISIEALWAGGAPGQIGTAIVRFRLPEELPVKDGLVPISVRINGRQSNTVQLPVN